jgi:hypothetical protein
LTPRHGDSPYTGGDERPSRPGLRALGLGLITGAADDDCSATGTYASAGARFGPAMLWTARVTLPMMFTVVYLSKPGKVSGRGLLQAIRDYIPRWVLYATLIGVTLGNTIEAAADLGGMAAAINLFVPLPVPVIVVPVALAILALQIWAPTPSSGMSSAGSRCRCWPTSWRPCSRRRRLRACSPLLLADRPGLLDAALLLLIMMVTNNRASWASRSTADC